MTLAFMNMGTPELLVILVLILGMFIGIGNYGRNTQLGYMGSVLLAIFTTPILAFIVIWYMRIRRRTASQS